MIEPILQVFLTEGAQDYQVRLRTCGLPAEGYGILLYDLARHVAQMFAKESGGKYREDEVLRVVLEWFDKERNRPTSDARTDILH